MIDEKKSVEKVLKGSEKQIAWARDIISGANEAIQRFNLYKISEQFSQNENAAWFIENYSFASKKIERDIDKYEFYKNMLHIEFELRAAGKKKKERNRIIHDEFCPLYDEIEEQYLWSDMKYRKMYAGLKNRKE